jgi:hypothetical protein
VQAVALLLAAACTAAPPQGWFDVRAHGAAGDGRTDDTEAIRRAVVAAKAERGVAYFPAGIYKVTGTIRVTEGEAFSCRIEGANPEGAVIVSHLRDTSALFEFRGGSGKFSNVGLRNLSLVTDAGHDLEGAAVLLDGQGFGMFENLRIRRFRTGIWLRNHSPGSFTEVNVFSRVNVDFCMNGVRMEAGQGGTSFHGNVFDGVFMNVGSGQKGFNHVSGYYYNGRFRLLMWAHGDSAILVNADGNAEHNIGDITYEAGDGKSSPFGTARLAGRGRFWYNGHLRGIGPFEDATSSRGRDSCQQVFACDNYWGSRPYGTTGYRAGPLPGPTTSYNGPFGYFQSLRAPGVESVLLNTPEDGKSANGLYLGTSAFRCPEPRGKAGLFLSGDGRKIESMAASGLRLEATSVAVPRGGLSVGAVARPSEALEVAGNIRATGSLFVEGGVWSAEDSAAVRRGTPVAGALEKALRLKAVRYGPAGSPGKGRRKVGMEAGDVEKEFPELVTTGADGRKAVDYARLAPFLLEAVREQQSQIAGQQRRIDRLDSLIEKLISAGER